MVKLDREAKAKMKSKPRVLRWPAVACGCEYNGIRKCDHSRGYIRVKYADQIKSRILLLGNIGTEINGCCLGCCAEQHAANDVVKCDNTKHNDPKIIDKLVFTKAIRPRTRQEVKPCMNCKMIFNP
jgi:hypothetical protein